MTRRRLLLASLLAAIASAIIAVAANQPALAPADRRYSVEDPSPGDCGRMDYWNCEQED